MKYKHLMCANGNNIPAFEDGDEVHESNFSRPFTGTPLLIDGGKKVLFVGCNLINCATTIPSEDCNTYCGELPVDEPVAPQSETDEIAEKVKNKADTDTMKMLASLLKKASIDEVVGLYNADGVIRIKKA